MGIKMENSILEFQPNVVEEVRRLYGYNSQEDMDKAVQILDQWVKRQKHFIKKDFAPEYLERVIISCKGSMEKAKTKIDKLCTFRTLLPQYFEIRDFKTEFEGINSVLHHGLVTKTTKEHERVIYIDIFGKKFDSHFVLNYLKAGFQIAEYMRAYDYSTSYNIVVDCRETNLKELLSNINIFDLQRGVNVYIDAYGIRVKSIHLISNSRLIDMVVSLLKQVVPKKIGDRVQVHKSSETLYNYLPKEILPKDFGGYERSLAKLTELWKDVFSGEDWKNYLEEAYKATTNESLRPRDTFNDQYMGVAGTFRTLTVD